MRDWKPVIFAMGAETGRAPKGDGGHLLNCYAEKKPDSARQPVLLLGTAGLALFCDTEGARVYGIYPFNGRLYAITDNAVYAIESGGAKRLVAPVVTSGRCSIADNGVEMVWVDGFRGYVMNAAETVTQITSPNFRTARSVTYINGFFVFAAKDSGQYFISGLYDGLTYEALDFATAESSPDNLQGVLNDHQELWLFGTKTVEVHFYNGAADFPFQRSEGSIMEHGCASPYCFAKMDNHVLWLSQEGIVYRAAQSQPQRISTHEIEQLLRAHQSVWSGATAFTYYEEGHAYYVLNVGPLTLVFDGATQMWHQRGHIDHDRHLADMHAFVWGKHLVGDFRSGKIYHMSFDYHDDAGRPLVSRATSGSINAGKVKLHHGAFSIVAQAGVGLQNGEHVDPLIAMQFSDDEGETWSSEVYGKLGRIGERLKAIEFTRLGQSESRRYRWTISAPVRREVGSVAYLRARA